MARVKKLKENGSTIYPTTIPQAVVDPETGEKWSSSGLRHVRATAHGRYYKFLSIARNAEKGIVRFSISSPLMGFADYMLKWRYESEAVKSCEAVCISATGAEMHERVKLVRTGNDSFDVYFESNTGNDYPSFVFLGAGGTKTTKAVTGFAVSVVSSIPAVYGESAYAGMAFANASDAINIDNYPQAEYGTVVIWYNRAEADGAPPGQEGVIYQTKYRSELGESGSTYVDCLTQLYVGSGGIKHRTVIDYDDAAPFDGVAWSGNSPQVIPVYVYQASGYIDLTGIAAQDIDTNKPVYVKDVYGGGSGLIPLSCTRNGSTMYITFTYFDTDYGTPVIAYKQINQTEFGKHVNLSFKEL